MSILFILYIVYSFIHIQYAMLYITFYDKLYGLSQKIFTSMLNLSIQPVILFCRLTAGLHIRALVAVVLYSVFQPFNLFGSPDYLHSHLLLPTIIISQKARFITFILWISFFSCIISIIYGYNQSYISAYGIYNYFNPQFYIPKWDKMSIRGVENR